MPPTPERFTTTWLVEHAQAPETVVATLEGQTLTLAFETRAALVRTLRPEYQILRERDAAALARVLLVRTVDAPVRELRPEGALHDRHPVDATERPIIAECPLAFRDGRVVVCETHPTWGGNQLRDTHRLTCRCSDPRHATVPGRTCDINSEIGRPEYYVHGTRAVDDDELLEERPYARILREDSAERRAILSEVLHGTLHVGPEDHAADEPRVFAPHQHSLMDHQNFRPVVEAVPLPVVMGPHAAWNAAHDLGSVFEEEQPQAAPRPPRPTPPVLPRSPCDAPAAPRPPTPAPQPRPAQKRSATHAPKAAPRRAATPAPTPPPAPSTVDETAEQQRLWGTYANLYGETFKLGDLPQGRVLDALVAASGLLDVQQQAEELQRQAKGAYEALKLDWQRAKQAPPPERSIEVHGLRVTAQQLFDLFGVARERIESCAALVREVESRVSRPRPSGA